MNNLLDKQEHDKNRDEAQSSLVLVETDKGKRFGGFTTCSWEGECIDKKDENAFVFSLDKMMIYENIPGEDAIGCYPKFGPIFLGCQIRIYDNAFSKGGTTFTKCCTWATIPLTAALSGNSTVLFSFFNPRAATVARCFGIAPIVDFTNVIFNLSAISNSSLTQNLFNRFAAKSCNLFRALQLFQSIQSSQDNVLLVVGA